MKNLFIRLSFVISSLFVLSLPLQADLATDVIEGGISIYSDTDWLTKGITVAMDIFKSGKPKFTENNIPAINAIGSSEEDPANWNFYYFPATTYSSTNIYGANTIQYQYQVMFYANGNYLKDVKIVPIKTNISWGWDLDISVEALIVNTGSVENPLAEVTLQVTFVEKTLLSLDRTIHTFKVRADGQGMMVPSK